MFLLIITTPLLSFLVSIFLGRVISHKGAALISCYLLSTGLFFSILSFYEVVLLCNPCYFFLGNWISISQFSIYWSFYFDSLTVSMVLVVYIVSTIVHIYSVDYMWGDPHFPRFMAYLSFFTFFMIVLVSSGNVLQVFIGWEGVGLCSFLLISFWFSRTQAVLSALKAFIVNRVGDLFFILACCLIFFTIKSLDYSTIFLALKSQKNSCLQWVIGFKSYQLNKTINIFNFFKISYMDAICLCFFIAAMSKSAQIFLHTWLPDAMEGPTPVSALIHAATMVAAGVFLVLRLSFVFDLSKNILQIITIIGGLTCFFAGTVGFFQNDIKKIIAYSTCSQLGYMFFAIGLSLYSLSFFHLCSHAFFKALLFLSSGAIIHSLEGSQDLRKMGGLITKKPLNYIAFLIGSLALVGIPFFSGFYSKEAILEAAIVSSNRSYEFSAILGYASAAITAAYSYKMLHLAFFSETFLTRKSYLKLLDHGRLMNYSLILLSILSIFFGFFFKDQFISYGSSFWSDSGSLGKSANKFFDYEFHPFFLKNLPIVLGLFGIATSTSIWILRINYLKILPKKVFQFFLKKWYFDNIFTDVIAKITLGAGYKYIYKSLDKGFWELIGPLGLSKITESISAMLIRFQTGFIYHYIVYVVVTIFTIPIIFVLVKLSWPSLISSIWLVPVFLYTYYLYAKKENSDVFYNNYGIYLMYLLYAICAFRIFFFVN